MSEIPKIAPIVSSILSSFDKLIASSDISDGPHTSVASSCFGRFKLWSASSGAHQQRTRSLDYKLRGASTLKFQVTSLLKELRDVLDEVNKGPSESRSLAAALKLPQQNKALDKELVNYFSNDETPSRSVVDELLDDAKHVINCLLRLSIVIRNPTPYDHFLSRAKFIEGAEPFDIGYIRDRFRGLDDHELVERLGKSLSIRRQYFRYREDHFNHLSDGLPGTKGDQATTIASSIPEHLKKRDDSTVTPGIFIDDIDAHSEVATSYAASEADSDQPRVPPVPSGYIDGPIKCPFCHAIIRIDGRRAWKKHVFRDLQPYICLAKSCPAANKLYERRRDWSQHMRLEHWRLWKCPLGCNDDMHTPEEFQQHVSSRHENEISRQHVNGLVRICSVSYPVKARGPCLFCDQHLPSDKLYISHVSLHMEQLALFALPSVEYDSDEDDQDEDDQDEDDSDEDDQDEDGQDEVTLAEASKDNVNSPTFLEQGVLTQQQRAALGMNPAVLQNINSVTNALYSKRVPEFSKRWGGQPNYVPPHQMQDFRNQCREEAKSLVLQKFLQVQMEAPMAGQSGNSEDLSGQRQAYHLNYTKGVDPTMMEQLGQQMLNQIRDQEGRSEETKPTVQSENQNVSGDLAGGAKTIVENKEEGDFAYHQGSAMEYQERTQEGELWEVEPTPKRISKPGETPNTTTVTVWYCNDCNYGPNNINLDNICPNCQHTRCRHCTCTTLLVRP